MDVCRHHGTERCDRVYLGAFELTVMRFDSQETTLATKADIADLRAEMYRAFLIYGFVLAATVIGSPVALTNVLGG